MSAAGLVLEDVAATPGGVGVLDAIDLESNTFVTLPVAELLKEHGNRIPGVRRLVSVLEGIVLQQLSATQCNQLLDVDRRERAAV